MKYILNKNIDVNFIEKLVIILPKVKKEVDLSSAIVLENTGLEIFNYIFEKKEFEFEELFENFKKEYNINFKELKKDILEFLNELERKKIIIKNDE